jgi:hypothetical protein
MAASARGALTAVALVAGQGWMAPGAAAQGNADPGQPGPVPSLHAPAPDPTDIGSRPQYWFNAQGLIAESTYVRIFQQRPLKHPDGPLLVADRPWEGTLVQLYSSDVHHDPATGRWQMWYEGHPGPVLLCTAFSNDGVRWEKPALGLQEWQGNKENNIILQTGYTDAHCASLAKAPNEADPARRYKLYFWVGPEWFDYHIKPMGLSPDEAAEARSRISAYKRNGHYVAFSPDGVRFTPQTDSPVLTTSDFATVLFDGQRGVYRSYHKIDHQKPGWAESRRCLWLAESRDGVTFGKSQLVLAPDEADDAQAGAVYGARRVEFYGVHVWPHEGFYLGLLWVFTVTGGNAEYGRGWDDGKIQPHLVYSLDGIDWQRLPVREPFIPLGPAGSFDSGTLYSTGNQPVVIGDEMRFYYFGCDYTHGNAEPKASPRNYSGFSFVRLPRNRFVAWHAATVPGTLLTKALRFSGKELHLNVDASRGETRAALLDAEGKALPGFSLQDCVRVSADSFDHAVTWRGGSDLSALAGEAVRLQFSLRHSMLYAWQFR